MRKRQMVLILILAGLAGLAWNGLAEGQETNSYTGSESVDEGYIITPTGNMNVGRSGHSATLLKNGKVLVVGGCTSISPMGGHCIMTNTSELYDPDFGIWTLTGQIGSQPNENGRSNHLGAALLERP